MAPTELAALGKRLYTLVLPHDQAGVAWSHYQLHKAALEAAVGLALTAPEWRHIWRAYGARRHRRAA